MILINGINAIRNVINFPIFIQCLSNENIGKHRNFIVIMISGNCKNRYLYKVESSISGFFVFPRFMGVHVQLMIDWPQILTEPP